MTESRPILEITNAKKTFGLTRALDGVSFSVRAGSVHALVGENGAGKSTLVKVLSGYVQPDEGEIRVGGKPRVLDSYTAEDLGIHMVHQELALLEDLTVAENIFIGREPRRRGLIDRRRMEAEARELLARLGADIDPGRRVEGLSTAAKQMVEIARGLAIDAEVLILDEPTAALSPEQAENLFAVIRDLIAQGHAVVYISHRLAEVIALADEITVLKDGKVVTTRPAEGLEVNELASLMVGRRMAEMFPPKRSVRTGKVLLEVEGLVDPPRVRGVSFAVEEGEVLGLYGLEGNGQDEILSCLAGDRRPSAGRLRLAGREVAWSAVPGMLRQGFGYVPQDRKGEGLLLEQSALANAAFPMLRALSRLGAVLGDSERRVGEDAVQQAGVKGDVTRPVATLSGGNQQKVSFARLVAAGSQVMLLNQPTRGVDVGSKREIYDLVRKLCEEEGKAAVVTSPELSELLGLCDRVLVIDRGRLVGEAPEGAEEEELLEMAVSSR
jgi:ABC-type sugar transport system ATPase subunit